MTISPEFRYRPRLVVMLKLPQAGRVKTRLGRDIGMTTAAWWFRHQTRALLRRLEDPRWELILAVSPDHAGLTARVWPAHLARMPQGQGDLGARMSRVFYSLPPGPVCIIGGDIPCVTKAHIARGFAALGPSEAVLGPAPDGGFWLIGLKRASPPPRGMFEGVRWSSKHAMSDTQRSLGNARVALIDTLHDVDTAQDLL